MKGMALGLLLVCAAGALCGAGSAITSDAPPREDRQAGRDGGLTDLTPVDATARYTGHKVVRVEITNVRDLRTMEALSGDMWSEAAGIGEVDYRVSPEAFEALGASGLRYGVLIDDVQALIDRERAELEEARREDGAGGSGGRGGPAWFVAYKNLGEIEQYVETLRTLRPDLMSSFSVGDTVELRPTKGARIVGRGVRERPILFLNACEHAREWIAPMTLMYIADALVRGHLTDARITRILDRVEFLVVPVANPDGYVYSWGPDRLWRKNRRDNGDGAFGVDINRNFGFQWGGVGASPLSNAETYRGPAAWSEPETRNLRDLVEANPRIRAHVDLHSYAQKILSPWGYTSMAPPDGPLFTQYGSAITSRINAVNGALYSHGQWNLHLYPSSGDMIDWVYGQQGVLSWTWELRDRGSSGFLLPPSQIVPTGTEVLAGMLYLAETLFTPGDWNGSGETTVQDVFEFLAAWFAGDGDFNGDGPTTVQDVFDFLAAWFS